MQCFNNFLGIYRNTANPSTSGVYISDLEGMNYNRLEAIFREDTDRDVEEFVQRKIDFAMQLVLDDVKGYLNPAFRLNTILEGYKEGAFTGSNLAAYAGERGSDLKIKSTRLSRVYITGVYVSGEATNGTLSRTLKIIDGNTELTYDFFLPASGGESMLQNKDKNRRVLG